MATSEMQLLPPLLVTAVHPGRRLVPANVTRVHVTFSQPVLPGTLQGRVVLTDVKGVVRLPPAHGERWNLDRSRLTFEIGPAAPEELAFPLGGLLREGCHYRIVVEPGAISVTGAEMTERYEHVFLAGPPVCTTIDPSAWKLALPSESTREPLIAAFPYALDLLGLERLIRVVDARGRPVRGEARCNDGGTSWWFVPDDAWAPGLYATRVDPDLRDVSGNNLVHTAETLDREWPRSAMATDLGFCLGPMPAPAPARVRRTRRVARTSRDSRLTTS